MGHLTLFGCLSSERRKDSLDSSAFTFGTCHSLLVMFRYAQYAREVLLTILALILISGHVRVLLSVLSPYPFFPGGISGVRQFKNLGSCLFSDMVACVSE